MLSARNLLSEEIGNKEPNIRRSLRQTAHEVGIPMGAERNIHADRITLLRQLVLQIAANSVEHLKLDCLLGQTNFFGMFFRKLDPLIVLRSDGRNRRNA